MVNLVIRHTPRIRSPVGVAGPWAASRKELRTQDSNDTFAAEIAGSERWRREAAERALEVSRYGERHVLPGRRRDHLHADRQALR